MATPEEESRKLLCVCGKQQGTFTTEGLGIKCRHCPETTVVPYRISNLEQAVNGRPSRATQGHPLRASAVR